MVDTSERGIESISIGRSDKGWQWIIRSRMGNKAVGDYHGALADCLSSMVRIMLLSQQDDRRVKA